MEVFRTEPWVQNLVQNHQLLNCHVTAFGLALIGDLLTVEAFHSIWITNVEYLKKLFADISMSFVQLHSSVRCSFIMMLQSVWMASNKDLQGPLLAGIDIPCILRNGLLDGSIFVSRETKNLAVHYIVSEMNAKENLQSVTDMQILLNEDKVGKGCSEIIDWLVGLVKSAMIGMGESNCKTLIALEVFRDVLRTHPDIGTNLCRLTKLKVLSMEVLINSEVQGICNLCCSLLVSVNSWSFNTGIPSEWVAVFEMLLIKTSHPPLMTAATFVVTTCSRFLMDRSLRIPIGLMSLMLEPIKICYDWKAKEKDTNCLQTSKWWKPIQKNYSDQGVLVKLCCYCQANVLALQELLSIEEKLDFIKMLTFVMAETGNPVTLSSKIQAAVPTVLASLLETIYDGNSKAHYLTCEDQREIWLNIITAAELPSSSVVISTNRMRLIRVLLRWTNCKELLNVWMDVCDRINQLLQKRLHDMQWEIRDSGIETLGEIIQKSKDSPFLSDWCITSGLLKILVASMDDFESYVRASILHVLGIIPTMSSQMFAETSELLPLEQIIAILLTEDDGMVRRAAIKALVSWTFAINLRQALYSRIANVFFIASTDVDWEVKLISIDFWIAQYNSIKNDSKLAEDLLENLIKIGFCDVMMQLSQDQDLSVRSKMATLVRRFKMTPIIEKYLYDQAGNEDKPMLDEHNVQFPQPCMINETRQRMTDDDKYSAIDKVLDTIDSKLVNDVMVSRTEQPIFSTSKLMVSDNNKKLDRLIFNHHRYHEERVTLKEFLFWLQDVDLDLLLQQSNQITDIYETNPESLLDDLIVAHEESETEEEISLDCY